MSGQMTPRHGCDHKKRTPADQLRPAFEPGSNPSPKNIPQATISLLLFPPEIRLIVYDHYLNPPSQLSHSDIVQLRNRFSNLSQTCARIFSELQYWTGRLRKCEFAFQYHAKLNHFLGTYGNIARNVSRLRLQVYPHSYMGCEVTAAAMNLKELVLEIFIAANNPCCKPESYTGGETLASATGRWLFEKLKVLLVGSMDGSEETIGRQSGLKCVKIECQRTPGSVDLDVQTRENILRDLKCRVEEEVQASSLTTGL